jgi:hypothetical protein
VEEPTEVPVPKRYVVARHALHARLAYELRQTRKHLARNNLGPWEEALASEWGTAVAVEHYVCVHTCSDGYRLKTGGGGANARAQEERYSVTKAMCLKLSVRLCRSLIYSKYRCLVVGDEACHV